MIYNACYMLIFLAFARKLHRKLIEDSVIPVAAYDGDGSDCWVVRIGDACVAYSYDKFRAKDLARELMKAFPGSPVSMIEDEDVVVDAFNLSGSGLDERGRGRLVDIVAAWQVNE